MHNRFKKKINLNQLIDLNQKQQQQEKSAAEMSVDSKMETSEIIVYTLEACEAKQQNSMEDSPSIISSVTNTVSAFY